MLDINSSSSTDGDGGGGPGDVCSFMYRLIVTGVDTMIDARRKDTASHHDQTS